MSVDKNVQTSIHDAIAKLARELPADQIRFADIARHAHVHWTTVRRHIGSREALRTLLRAEQQAQGVEQPETRARILRAAQQVFAEQGYAGASLDDVAMAAHLTKGAVYWHFSSKSDVFLSLLEQNVLDHVRLLPGQLAAVAAAPGDKSEAVEHWLVGELQRLTADRRQAKLYFEFVSSTRDEVVERRMQEVRHKAFAAAKPLLESLQSRGILTDRVDPMTLGLLVNALFDGLTLAWIVDRDGVHPGSAARALARLLLRGIAGSALSQTSPEAD